MESVPNSPVYAVIYTENPANSPKEIFRSVKEAVKFVTTPESKIQGARFKKFSTDEEALKYLASGDFPTSPLATTPSRVVASEPAIPSPSLKLTDYTALKKTIEKGDLLKFCELVDSNPRYLINTSGDTASILVEGSRYNALHIASRTGKSLFVNRILSYITDVGFIMNCYGTTEEDAKFRMKYIVDSMLNTPDKIPWNTPLHHASKLGHVDVVRALLTESALKKSPINREGKTPLEEACAGYYGDDKNSRKKEIELLLNGFYVALYRTAENISPPKLTMTGNVPQAIYKRPDTEHSPIEDEYHLAASAGPFYSQMDVENFYQKWNQTGKDTKRSDPDKGYERIGRELANGKVSWAEAWFFCSNEGLLNFTNTEHLKLLNEHIGSLRFGKNKTDSVRLKLDFDNESYEEEEIFEDALENQVHDDSLAGLADVMSALTLNSPKAQCIRRESANEEFLTPPSSPLPVYLLGLPTKSDTDLYLALTQVPANLLEPFSHIRFFMRKIAKTEQRSRADWPSKDSPRINRSLTPRRLRLL